MPCIGLSRGPAAWSAWNFRGSGPWEAFRGLEDALALVFKVAEFTPDNSL